MGWPPQIGETLPRAAEAWCAEEKWAGWILAEAGHRSEWGRVFHASLSEWERAWEAIAAAMTDASIQTVRDLGAEGVSCGVSVELTLGERTATVTTAWHYADEEAAPRLITAYPTPYNRGHGSRT
jgi:hypothetical protein